MSCGTHQTHDIVQVRSQAAVYRVRFRKQFLNKPDIRNDKIYHWTDSSTISQWLQAADMKEQMFVANRATEILEKSSIDQ